jgi:hypothetical protein
MRMDTSREPLQQYYLRLQEPTHARASGHHSHVLSEPEMEWICWTTAILGFLFLVVALWSRHDARRFPKKTVDFRSYTKRRHKRRKRNQK